MSQNFTLSAFADEAAEALDGQIVALQENGIQNIEIRGVDGVNIADLTDAQLQTAKEKLKAGGITVSAIGSPIGKVQITDPAQEEYDRFKRVLDIAAALDAPAIRMFNFYYPKGDTTAQWRDEIMLRCGRFLEIAQGSGIMLGMENEGHIFGEQIAECADLLDTFEGGYKLVFDPCNFILSGVDPLEAFAKLRRHIGWMHLKDAKDGKIVPPGEGDCGLFETLKDRLETEGPCIITLEPHLWEFVGLASQHQGNEDDLGRFLSGHNFKDGREAFDFAAGAVKGLLVKMGR